MDIIETFGGSVNYDEMMDAEPIMIDGIPYMVMGHAQYYVDSRVIHCALSSDTICEPYQKFVVDGRIDYPSMLNDIIVSSGLKSLITRHIDSLSSLWRNIDEYDDIRSRVGSKSGRVPERPPRQPDELTPAALKTWAEAVAAAITSRGVRVPKFHYPRKCNWISETSQPKDAPTAKSLMSADMICCRYAECLEWAYVYVAKYLSDLQDALITRIKK